jgi:transcriptional regulator NrdR family protein
MPTYSPVRTPSKRECRCRRCGVAFATYEVIEGTPITWVPERDPEPPIVPALRAHDLPRPATHCRPLKASRWADDEMRRRRACRATIN